jgi:hypothetical membrane protein
MTIKNKFIIDLNYKQYAIIGLMAPLMFTITYLIMSQQRPEYSFLTKAISELGSLEAPNKWYWNIFGYILPGVFISIFSIGLYESTSTSKSSKLPLIGFFLSGVMMILSGVFPGDFEHRSSPTMVMHTIGSIGCYIFFLLGAFSYRSIMKKNPYWKFTIRPSLILTWLTIVFGSWQFVFPEMPGAGQRIVFSLYYLWIIYNGYKLYLYNTFLTSTPTRTEYY